MKLRLFLFLLAVVCTQFPVRAADVVTTTVTLNTAPTNGQSATFNGNTRTWTNNITSSPGTLIQTTNTVERSTTNLLDHLTSYGFLSGAILGQDNSTNVTIRGLPGQGITISISGGWATVTYVTNTSSPVLTVRVPYDSTLEQATNQTNIASQILRYMNDLATNAFKTNFIGLTNFLSLGTPYHGAITQKVRGDVTVERLQGGTNLATIWGGTNYGTMLSNIAGFYGFIGVASNGTIWLTKLEAVQITNAAYIHGFMGALTNGIWINGIAHDLKTTNLVNYGNAISSPGTNGVGSEQFGTGAIANKDYAFAGGNGAQATNAFSTILGNTARSGGDQATGGGRNAYIGANSTGWGDAISLHGTNLVGLGSGVEMEGMDNVNLGTGSGVGHTISNTVSLGTGSSPTKSFQFTIPPTYEAYIPGSIRGILSNVVFAVNATNQVYGDWAWNQVTNTTLAASNNVVDPGTNTVIRVVLPGNGSISSVMRARPGRYLEFINDSPLYTLTVDHESGFDPIDTQRIKTPTGQAVSYGFLGVIKLRYSPKYNRWELENPTAAATNAVATSGGAATNLTVWQSGAGPALSVESNAVFKAAIVASNLTVSGAVTQQNITASRVAVYNANKELTNAAPDITEINYVDGVTNAIQTELNKRHGYPMRLHNSSETPSDSTTVYFGGAIITPNATYSTRQLKILKTGTLVRVDMHVLVNTTLGSTETVAHYVRLNDTTDVAQIDALHNVTSTNYTVTLSQAVTAGDLVTIKVVHPAYSVNPGGISRTVDLYIE